MPQKKFRAPQFAREIKQIRRAALAGSRNTSLNVYFFGFCPTFFSNEIRSFMPSGEEL
ncbi:Hypothetical protein NGAL_HAMBI2605_29110 [Neorhizobium galegae bv. orientalis]|nr:Hypothetical protein NGAL_HAMBI2566_11860 [Neorhizobium galegae bv. orientalis]CDZ64296.1 Hypothetical protein NGAL_HAMBI2605_29110 [Neorhizobium galegae bv. orientalis]